MDLEDKNPNLNSMSDLNKSKNSSSQESSSEKENKEKEFSSGSNILSQNGDLNSREKKERISWQSSDPQLEKMMVENQELSKEKEEKRSEIELKEPPRPLYTSRKEKEGKFLSSDINLSLKHDPFAILKKSQKKKSNWRVFKKLRERYKNSSPLARFFLKYFLVFLFIYIIIYLIFNGPVFLRRMSFWQNKNVYTTNQSDNSSSNAPSDQNSQSSSQSQNNSSGSVNSQTTNSQNQSQVDIPQINKLVISKIRVDAPIIFLTSNNEAEMKAGLLQGVVHYHQTALPGEVGNCFIFGHSSNYWWEKSPYNYVFVTLDKMQAGDKATIYYNGQVFEYSVIEVKIVEATDTSVLNPTPEPILTLMTCTPPGTSWKRLIIKLKQTYPVYTPKIVEKLKENPSLPEELPREKEGVTKKIYNFFYNLIY